MITQNELKKLLKYDPETGIFTWILHKKKENQGRVAGSLCNEYIEIYINGRNYYAHRLAWLYIYGEFPNKHIDHFDCDRGNNKIINLRLATPIQNGGNVKKKKNNTSGFKGVSWFSPRGKWRAQIETNGKQKHLGYFTDINLASAAYQAAIKNLYGEFSRV